jgi:2-methylisocitrate lyase-like PEP mutase family enzyme
MRSAADKAKAFRALHERDGAFVMPNPWDVGGACMLAQLGFEALATTSAGYAWSIGQRDNTVGRERMMEHVRAIVAATDLPVNADLENGFGDDPATVAETIRMAAAAGLAGCSIEDSTSTPKHAPVYGIESAAERIRAAAEAVRALPRPFVLTARAENFVVSRPDLKDTIARLQAYQEAGADVLYAPGLPSKDAIATVVKAVDRPVNVLVWPATADASVADLSALGVKRISTGSVLARAAIGAFLRGAREMREHGTFGFLDAAASSREIAGILES